MNAVIFDKTEYDAILQELAEIKKTIQQGQQKISLSETWLDNQDVCTLLKISKRTLQSYRDEGILSFSQIANKIYYRASDVEEHLQKHYNKAFKK